MKIKLLIAIAIFFLPRLTTAQLIEPDPGTGRPLLVAGANLELEVPIELYDDPMVAIYTAQSYLIASVQFGYKRTGVYDVDIYTFLKDDRLCMNNHSSSAARWKYVPDEVKRKGGYGTPAFEQKVKDQCHYIRYLRMRLVVNTHKQTLITGSRHTFDRHGNLNMLDHWPDDKVWTAISKLYDTDDSCLTNPCANMESPYLKTVVKRLTQLMERESEP